MSDVTRILSAIEAGDPHAAEQLLPLVYDELRKLAAQRLAHERPGQTLEATALVHEAYLRLVGSGKEDKETWRHGDREKRNAASRVSRSPRLPVSPSPDFANRGHFFAAAAEAMRRILIENARRKRRGKRGGGRRQVDLDSVTLGVDMPVDHLLALDEALTRLAERDTQASELVKLHCFAGLSIEQAAAALGLSTRTAYRDWTFAQAWLYREIRGSY